MLPGLGGGNLKHLGDDISEMLELEPVRFKVIRQVRPKLACASCDTIVQASAPTRPIERGIAGPGLLAHVLVGKMPIISRFIGKRKSWRARASNWTASTRSVVIAMLYRADF